MGLTHKLHEKMAEKSADFQKTLCTYIFPVDKQNRCEVIET